MAKTPTPVAPIEDTTITTSDQAIAPSKPLRWWSLAAIGIIALVLGHAALVHWQNSKPLETTTGDIKVKDNGPVYPIEGTFTIDQNGRSSPINVDWNEKIDVYLLEDNVWLDTYLNNGDQPYRQAPRISGNWRPNDLGAKICTLQYQVTPGTKILSGTIRYVKRKNS